MDSVAVYCGSATGNSEAYALAARQLGEELARRGLTMVYGGGDVGLMGIVADACLAAGGHVIGVIPQQLVDFEVSHQHITQLEVVDTMAQRKTRMEELADAFVCLPGGVGTLEELTEVLTMQQLGNIDGPVGLVDVQDFWQPFVRMYAAMVQEGFVQQRFLEALVVDPAPSAVLDAFGSWTSPGAKWGNN